MTLPSRPLSSGLRVCALGLVLCACAADGAPASRDDARDDVLAAAQAPDAKTAHVQILGFNDFHGNIEPPTGASGSIKTGSGSVPAGGAAFFASHLAALRAQNPNNTIVVSAGDLIGGMHQPVSGLFHDEPTVEAMNLMGLAISAVGNHEFDGGPEELVRMQKGGCHPVDGCQDGTPFAGGAFTYLAANVQTQGSDTLFPRYTVRTLDGVKIAFIGLTLEGTAKTIPAAATAGLTFGDEADTVNALVPELRGQGIETIVVLLHEGGFQTGTYDACDGISGAVVDIVKRLDDAVDLVLSGHTHAAYNCVIAGKRVTSAMSFGRLVTEVHLDIDRATRDVVHLDAHNRIVTRDVTPDPQVGALVSRYVDLAQKLPRR